MASAKNLPRVEDSKTLKRPRGVEDVRDEEGEVPIAPCSGPRHIKKKHSLAKEKKNKSYKCPVRGCGRTYHTKPWVRRHMRSKHSGGQVEQGAKVEK